MKLQNVKIGKRLLGNFAIFAVIIMLLCAISIINMNSTEKRVNEMTSYNFEKGEYSNQQLNFSSGKTSVRQTASDNFAFTNLTWKIMTD